MGIFYGKEPMKAEQNKLSDEIEIRDQSGDPFTAVWNWMLDRSDLTGMEKLVWIALKSYAGCREIRPSVQTVARRASVGIRTVQRTFDVLSRKGLIRVERRSRPDGGYATNRYILLPSSRETRKGGVGVTVAPTPDVSVTPAPDAIMTPPQVSQRHQEKIILIKDKTTTHLLPEKRSDGGDPQAVAQSEQSDGSKNNTAVVVVDEIKKLISDTPFRAFNELSLRTFIKKYGHKYVFDTLDMIIETYKQLGKPITNPGAILSIGLMRGVTSPSDYVPYHERIEKERKVKEMAEQNRVTESEKKKADEEAYNIKAAEFDALPEEDREPWLNRARATMHPLTRTSKIAVRSGAISLFRGG